MEEIKKRLDAQSVILNKILDQVYKIDRVEQMVEHVYLDMTNKSTGLNSNSFKEK